MAGQSGANAQQSNPLLGFLPLVLILVIMYFLMLRPQAKKQKEHREMLSKLEKGDKVVTAGGIFGTIAGIKEKENTVILKVADNVKIEITRSSIAQVLKKK
ncbi:preprotein translocase subunit YajC [candidate division KSB1 bacterium]|nr:MAG: preprotein translocase subunit YajC [candidate division KSB1 bacterium]